MNRLNQKNLKTKRRRILKQNLIPHITPAFDLLIPSTLFMFVKLNFYL
jgi:hypothetical protein